ncbi:MAG: thioesterase family protein [Candidatus Caldarchaeum sp.]
MTVHVERFRVGFQDTDSTTRIYFPTYVRWFDMAFIEFLRKNGVVFDASGKIVFQNQVLDETLVIGEYGCRILKPSKYDDLLEVRVSITELRDKVVRADFTLTSVDTGGELSRGWITYVCVDTGSGRSSPFPNELRRMFEASRNK